MICLFSFICLSSAQIIPANSTVQDSSSTITVNLHVEPDILTSPVTPNTTNSTVNASVSSAVILTSYPQQLDYSTLGVISDDSKIIDFCDSSWAIAAAYLY
jgi:hypothetical protein